MIKIQGIPYKIITYKNDKEVTKRMEEINKEFGYKDDGDNTPVDGFVDYNRKEIHLSLDERFDKRSITHTIRHEIVHAFLYEIGNKNHSEEEFVDKIARWMPELNRIYNDLLKDIKYDGN